MIPGISPAIITKASGSGAITGTITVGNYSGYYYGYMAANDLGVPPFGSVSGDAAAYIGPIFYWSSAEAGGGADAKGTTTAKLVFQGATYNISGGSGGYGWDFGPEVATWPTSGTHTFEIIDP